MLGYVSGPFYITGAEGMERFTVVGKFAKKVSKILKEKAMDNNYNLNLANIPKELKLIT